MKRRSRSRPSVVVNYWPGYVDALTNVVLNLLFLIAMFGIALTVLNGRGKRQGPEAPAGAELASVTGPEGGRADGAGGAGTAVHVLPPGGRPPFVLRYGSPGQAAGPRALAGNPAPAAAVSAAAGTPVVSAATLPLGGAGQTAGAGRPAPTGQPAIAAPPSAALRAGRGQPGTTLAFSVADAYQRRFTPGVRLSREPAARGAVLVTVNLAVGTEPVAALRQPWVSTALESGLATDEGRPARLRVWTATRLDDPVLRRTAYLALIEARNQLLALGYPADAIETRLIEGGTTNRDEKQIFILAVPASRR